MSCMLPGVRRMSVTPAASASETCVRGRAGVRVRVEG